MAATEISDINGWIIMLTDKGCFAKDPSDDIPVFYNVDYHKVYQYCIENELPIYFTIEKIK